MAFMKMLWKTKKADFNVKTQVRIKDPTAVSRFKVKVRVSIHNG